MIIELDPTTATPPYEQLSQQIRAMIIAGSLERQARLPTIRQLARDLNLAPGTVQRAYKELEAEGLVDARGRRGTFVADVGDRYLPDERDQRLHAAAASFATTAVQLGYEADEALVAADQALRDVRL